MKFDKCIFWYAGSKKDLTKRAEKIFLFLLIVVAINMANADEKYQECTIDGKEIKTNMVFPEVAKLMKGIKAADQEEREKIKKGYRGMKESYT